MGPPGKNLLNERVYPRCPRAIALEGHEARILVNLHAECREHGYLPVSGGPLEQTAFCAEVFGHLDHLMSKYREKQHNEQMRDFEKMKSKNSSKVRPK